jgi:hypothetical protein
MSKLTLKHLTQNNPPHPMDVSILAKKNRGGRPVFLDN